MKHTPKPWHMETVHDEPHYEIWHGQLGDADREIVAEYVSKENAPLLTAAPDMLGACEMMLRMMEGEDLDEQFDGEAEALRDAIARAKGEETK